MICVDHLCYHYKGGRPILRDVSFELEDGRFLAVLGNNGVGKSTLLKCMNRILTADSGHCRIDGEDLLTLSHREIAKRVAFVAQHVPDTQMTVHDMVMLGRRPYMTWGVTEHDHHVVHEAMRYLNLEDMRGRFLNQLSGGERQKVMLAVRWRRSRRSCCWTNRPAISTSAINIRCCRSRATCAASRASRQ